MTDPLRAALETARRDYLAKHDQSVIDEREFGPKAGANAGYPLVDDRDIHAFRNDIERIEAESRNATLDDVERAVEGLRWKGEPNAPMDNRALAAVLDAVKALRP